MKLNLFDLLQASALDPDSPNILLNVHLSDMSDKFDTAVLKAQLQQKNPGITGNDMTSINTNLREINEGLANLNDCARLRKWNRILMIAVTVLFVISAGAIYWITSLRSERDELVNVEWLYRYVRPSILNPKTLADLEARMFDGTDEQRDSIKSDAFTREANGMPFRSFTLHDDWKPEPPEPKKSKSEEEKEDSGGWFEVSVRNRPTLSKRFWLRTLQSKTLCLI